MLIEPDQFDLQFRESRPSRHSFYDLVKDILLPVASLVGMFFSFRAPLRLALFFIVAMVFGVLGLYPRVANWWGWRRERAKDTEIVGRAVPTLQKLIERFGDFVNGQFGGSFHHIVTSELSPNVRNGVIFAVGGPAFNLWQGFWYYVKEGVGQRPATTLDTLNFQLMEFHHLVAQFCNFCISPIFVRMEPELRQKLSENDRSVLNGFQQRYSAFVSEYEQFARALADSRPRLGSIPRFLPHSNPL